jgi:hypothetical protein
VSDEGPSREEGAKQRLARAVELLCDGTLTRGEIVERLSRDFGCSERSAWRSVKKAREEVLPAWYELGEQRVLVIETIAKATRHYRRCVSGQTPNHSAGLATLKWIAELQGVESIVKVELVGKVEVAGLAPERINDLRGMFGLPPRPIDEPGDDEPAADDLPVRPAPAGVD